MTELTQGELDDIDEHVIDALERVDYSDLNIIGNGELSVVIAWPTSDPTCVVKPIGPFQRDQYEAYRGVLLDYMAELDRRGVASVPTAIGCVSRGRTEVIGYMTQPLLERDSLAEHALGTFTPSTDNPLLGSIVDAIAASDEHLGIDAPISNWLWDGEKAVLLDVGLPLMWDEHGTARLTIEWGAKAFPAFARGAAIKELDDLLDRYREPRTAAVEFVARLPFFGLDAWQGPAVDALNQRLEPSEPITIAEAQKLNAADSKSLPRIKRLQRMQRWWVRRIRRQRYDFFIGQSTY